MSTTQNFDTPGTVYTLQQVGGPPPATVLTGGPTGNYLRLATTPTNPVAGNNNSISFTTSDPGSYNLVQADWDFRVTQTTPGQKGVGMSFALLNTTNYGTSGPAASLLPQQGIYDGSFAFGFDTTDNTVYASLNGAIQAAQNVPAPLVLASGQFIHARATIDFTNAAVSLTLTPSLSGSAVTVFSAAPIPGLTPYQSRAGYQAQSTNAAFANFDLDNVNVQFVGLRQAGTISFGSSNYVVNENQGVAQVEVIRTGGTAGSVTVGFVSADGTAKHGVNYLAVSGQVTFGEGETQKFVSIPIIDDGLFNGDKTVQLYLSNPTLVAPLVKPIVSSLTIRETDPAPVTVSPRVGLVYVPGTRRVAAFQLTFSQSMDRTSAQNLANYAIILPPVKKGAAQRAVRFAQASLDSSGLVVTLSRGKLGPVHLPKLVQILVRGTPPTGLFATGGTFLAGAGGVPGTNALLTVGI